MTRFSAGRPSSINVPGVRFLQGGTNYFIIQLSGDLSFLFEISHVQLWY